MGGESFNLVHMHEVGRVVYILNLAKAKQPQNYEQNPKTFIISLMFFLVNYTIFEGCTLAHYKQSIFSFENTHYGNLFYV